MPDLVTISVGPLLWFLTGLWLFGFAWLAESGTVFSQETRNAVPAIKTRERQKRIIYSFTFRCGLNQEGSLLLQPFVVSMVKSASVALLRSRVTSFSAETAQRFHPAACTPTISQAA